MTLEERARLVELAVKDLRDAVLFYAQACDKSKYGAPRCGIDEFPAATPKKASFAGRTCYCWKGSCEDDTTGSSNPTA